MIAIQPPGSLATIGSVLSGAVRRDIAEGTVIMPAPPLNPSSIPALIQGLGWSTVDTRSGWFTARAPAGNTIHFGFREWIKGDEYIGQPVAASNNRGDATIHRRLTAYLHTTGVHYRHTPGVPATIHLRSYIGNDKGVRWALRDPASTDYWEAPGTPAAPSYRRKVKPAELGLREVEWDMRAAYLAAAAAATLPYKALRHTGVDPNGYTCGYYRVWLPGMPAWWPGRRDRQGTIWVGPEMLQHIQRVGGPYEMIDSWTPGPDDRSGRILRPWAEAWRDLIDAAPNSYVVETLTDVLKAGYRQAFGLMGSKTPGIYRPDWRHAFVDYEAASLTRRVDRVHELTGLTPLRIVTDSVVYAVPHHIPLHQLDEALGVGPFIGRMQRKDTTPDGHPEQRNPAGVHADDAGH